MCIRDRLECFSFDVGNTANGFVIKASCAQKQCFVQLIECDVIGVVDGFCQLKAFVYVGHSRVVNKRIVVIVDLVRCV